MYVQAATKQFGTKILLSGDFLSCLSKPVQKKCRAIDRVTVKGSKKPMLFATYDVEEENLEFDPDDPVYKRPPIEFTSSKVAYENLFEEVRPVLDECCIAMCALTMCMFCSMFVLCLCHYTSEEFLRHHLLV